MWMLVQLLHNRMMEVTHCCICKHRSLNWVENMTSSVANLVDVQTRSIVYIPRENIEEVERIIRTRGLHKEDQVDFILSLLKGSALKEIKLCMGGQAKEHFLEHAVGEFPEVDYQIDEVSLRCLLDTGSHVSALTESFFRDYIQGEDEDMHCTASWLKITAANKLPCGLDIQVMGINIPQCGYPIFKDNTKEDKNQGHHSTWKYWNEYHKMLQTFSTL